MIENNHEVYVQKMPQIIAHVILEGSHSLSEEEMAHFTIEEFSPFYEEFLTKMNMAIPPLHVEEGPEGKTIRLHPLFNEKLRADDELENNFEAYCYLFRERFDLMANGEEIGEFQMRYSDQFEAEGFGDLASARQNNEDYTEGAIEQVLEGGKDRLLDDYGMTENRPFLAQKKAERMCDICHVPSDSLFVDAQGALVFKNKERETMMKANYLAYKEQQRKEALKRYAEAAALTLFNDGPDVLPKNEFNKLEREKAIGSALDELAETYVLPRFPIAFDSTGLPAFKKKEQEEAVLQLYMERKAQWDALKKPLPDQEGEYIGTVIEFAQAAALRKKWTVQNAIRYDEEDFERLYGPQTEQSKREATLIGDRQGTRSDLRQYALIAREVTDGKKPVETLGKGIDFTKDFLAPHPS